MSGPQSVGKAAEDRAAAELLARGYTLLTRRWRGGGGELDLVALEGDTLVMVEVKERAAGLTAALESLTPTKRRRLRQAAEAYQFLHDLAQHELRFDLALVTPAGIEWMHGVEI